MDKAIKVGIIGGSGLDDPKILVDKSLMTVSTVYGKPSSDIQEGKINGVSVAILSRHGLGHIIPPSQINNRANIQALKEVGVTHIIATTAVGSLKEEIGRGHFVVPDQVIDFTKHRINTFYDTFEHGLKHIAFADPFNEQLRLLLINAARKLELPVHNSGTVVTIEGPRFSSRAESNMFRQWGADIINMTTAPEAALAMEAGIPYAAVALSTDYDCWKTDEAPVTVEAVMQVFNDNLVKMVELLKSAMQEINHW